MSEVVTVDGDAIPEELKSRDQWLMWDAGADTPRRPHWRGDFGVSWNDPNDWHSFDEAISAARERDSWGIGYVFAKGNDDYMRGLYSALDLDGCVVDKEKGRLKEWLPSLTLFLEHDAYMEYSPSGEGIHIPLVGFDVPDWWSDVHFSAGEHEGVEAYESKFFTFTGDTLDADAQEVGEISQGDLEEWLVDVYEAIEDEDPRELHEPTAPSGSAREPSRTREELEGMEATADYDDVLDAVSQLEARDLRLRSTYVEDERTGVESWDPGYRKSKSGKSLKRFVDSGVWVDMRHPDDGFDVLNLFAAEQGIIREPFDALQGDEFHEAVEAAREAGAPIPEYDGERRELEEVDTDTDRRVGELTDEEVWDVWSEAREERKIGPDSNIPEAALWHIAKERDLYNFEALPDDVDELPVKAHNRALYWVNEQWADEIGLEEDTDATARPYKSRDPEKVLTWEDVRYIYDESKADGRYSAVRLLRREYEFIMPEDTEELLVYNEEIGVFEPGGRYDVGRLLDRELRSFYSQHEKNEIIGRLKEHSVERDELEAAGFDDHLVCVKNGVLNLDEKDENGVHELREHDPKYKFTTHLPVEYDPEADCPQIREFLHDITRREEDAKTLLEVLGNCLIPNYKHEYILFLFGEGANGKSTWLNVVRQFLGADNTTSLQLQKLAENRFATARLLGKWANIAEDLPSRKLQNTGTLKDLSGGGEVPAEKKGKDGFDFENRAKLMFAANRPPVLGEQTYAIKRRLVPVHLPYQYTHDPDDEHKQRDPHLLEKLTEPAELSGLLNAALGGLERLREQGDVSLPEDEHERLELYERHSDHIKAFRLDCLENEGGERLTKDEVYNAYTNFCDDRDREPVGKRTFWRTLRKSTLNVTITRLPEGEDGTRPRALENVRFTEEAKEQFAPDTSQSEDSSDKADAIASLAPGDEGVTVEVRSENRDTDTPPSIAEKTEVVDRTDSIEAIVWADASKPPLEEGSYYRIKNARVDEYNGARQLVVEQGTGVEEIGAGVGRSPPEDSGQNQRLGTATDGGRGKEEDDQQNVDSEPAAEVEGSLADARKLQAMLKEDGPMSESELVENSGLDDDRAEDVLSRAKQRGFVIESGEKLLPGS